MANSRLHPKQGRPKLRIVGGNNPNKRKPDFDTPTDKAYYQDLHRIIDRIFEEAKESFDWTWSQLAFHSELTYATVNNLGERITKYPRFQTIYKLARAIGWTLIVQKDKRARVANAARIRVAM